MSVRPGGEDDEFLVHYFEVDKDRYDEVLDTWDYDEPGLLLNESKLLVRGEEDLRRALAPWVPDLSTLVGPGATTIPI